MSADAGLLVIARKRLQKHLVGVKFSYLLYRQNVQLEIIHGRAECTRKLQWNAQLVITGVAYRNNSRPVIRDAENKRSGGCEESSASRQDLLEKTSRHCD